MTSTADEAFNSITNKLRDLHHDIARHDAVGFQMRVRELARRSLYDVELDALTIGTWSTGFDDAVWQLVAEGFGAVSKAYDVSWRAR